MPDGDSYRPRYFKHDPLLSCATEFGRSTLDVTDTYHALCDEVAALRHRLRNCAADADGHVRRADAAEAEVAALREELRSTRADLDVADEHVRSLVGERDALRAELADKLPRALRRAKDAEAEVERMRPVVEAAVRRRIAWHKDDDDAENIAADRSEDAAVDAYRATSEQDPTDA